MNTFNCKLVLMLLLASILLIPHSYSQQIIKGDMQHPLIQPAPKKMTYSGKKVVFNSFPVRLYIVHQNRESIKAANYFYKLVNDRFPQEIEVLLAENNLKGNTSFKINIVLTGDTGEHPDQYYRIDADPDQNFVTVSAPCLMGLLYGVVTLTESMQLEDDQLILPLFNIEDWPSFSRRIFPSILEKEDVAPILNFALLNKIETVALIHRQYPWYEVDERLEGIFEEIKMWKEKFGGPHVMQMHNIYDERQIEISSKEDVENLLFVIESGLNSGLNKVMILADDTPPFKFGQGYVLPHESDREKFNHMAEAHCYLLKKIKGEFADRGDLLEIHYVPAFYTYEDMHYGDMSQYDNTPWEQNAYGPLKRDLAYFGEHLPADVFILWTGPNVRTRMLTEANIDDWTKNLGGKVPFLWDNTIYSHHAFTSSALFTAYDNQMPEDLYKITGGNGMFINGNLNAEEMKAALITVNDYLWDPYKYDPEESLENAMLIRYGTELVDFLFEFKKTELELRMKIGERALWFEADTLWKIIRNTRRITEKNPLYYHLNYNGLKAMRMQLKYSVPEPQEYSIFLTECKKLDDQRRELLQKIGSINPGLTEDFEKILVRLPEQ